MTTISEIDLSQACGDYMVANTPLFLIRKFRASAAVRRIADTMSGAEITAALQEYATRQPETLRDAVVPYACLVALSMQNNIQGLRDAASIAAVPEHKWFNYIRSVLLQMATVSTHANIHVPNAVLERPPVYAGTRTSIVNIQFPLES